MGQQISIEVAFEGYRGKAVELFHENVLLRARVTELEERLTKFESEHPAGEPPQAGYEAPVSAVYQPGD